MPSDESDRLTSIPQFDIYLYSAHWSTGAWYYGGFDSQFGGAWNVKGVEAAFVDGGASLPVRYLSPFLVFIRFMELVTNPQYHRYLHSCVTYPFSPVTLIFKSPKLVFFLMNLGASLLKWLFGIVRHWYYWCWPLM